MSIVKVPLRPATMRLAGAWFCEALAGTPSLKDKLHPESLEFLLSLEKRGKRKGKRDPKIEVDRAFAERFVEGWRLVFRQHAPSLLRSEVDPVDAPSDGMEAIAEIVWAMARAVRQDAGRPFKVDPLEAFDRNEFQQSEWTNATRSASRRRPSISKCA